jgi:hypothetical protein
MSYAEMVGVLSMKVHLLNDEAMERHNELPED